MLLKKSLRLLLFASTFLIRSTFAQTPDSVVKLPYEMLVEIDGVKTKVILRSMSGDPEGTFAEVTFGFQNPQTGEWIYFDAEKARIGNEGFQPPFEVKLRGVDKEIDIKFIRDIIDIRPDGKYWWKCGCKEVLSDLQI